MGHLQEDRATYSGEETDMVNLIEDLESRDRVGRNHSGANNGSP